MKRTISALLLSAAALPLLAAVPASRVKEPNAVFAYDVDAQNRRITAVLFDRLRGEPLDHVDATVDFPLLAAGPSATVQFSPATKKIYVAHATVSAGDEGKGLDETHYDVAIEEGTFGWKDVKTVFSCKRCAAIPWAVHPTEAKLYLAKEDPYTPDEFRRAKLVEVTLAPSLRVRVIGRVPANAELRFTPDGRTLYVFGKAAHSRKPYGQLVTVRLRDRKRTATTVNFPTDDAYGRIPTPSTADASPDALEMAYHFGTVDALNGEATDVLTGEVRDVSNTVIGWSRDARNLLFQLTNGNKDIPLLYQRSTKRTWELPVDNAMLLAWAPAQSALLFHKDSGTIGYYDIGAHEWTDVFRAGPDFTGGASWATLPTKRVPSR